LALRSEGIKMTVGSELPHFIAMDNDILSTGVVIYHLQVCSINGDKCVCMHLSRWGIHLLEQLALILVRMCVSIHLFDSEAQEYYT